MKQPKLSIIVPIYNVENYLEDCLNSLLRQNYENYEVIMVDDGSTDNSKEIMHKYAEKYENFFAFSKENGGLGQARNYGAERATGDYITFVDSDDIVADGSYKLMMDTILKTNSDFIIGNVVRFNSNKEFPSVLHQKVFSEDKFQTNIRMSPELFYDTTAWNKIFKMEFWRKHKLSFPEGMLYEDIPVTIPAHFLADKVDVLTEIVYKWRSRDTGDQSITQQRLDISNLLDRIKALKMVDNFLKQIEVSSKLLIEKDYKVLSIDLLVYLNQLIKADDNYIDTYINEVSEYLKSINKEAFERLKVIDRMKYYFVLKKEKQKLLDLIEFEKTQLKKNKPIFYNGVYIYNYPYSDEVPFNYKIAGAEFVLKQKIESLKWDNNKLIATGYAFIQNIDTKYKNSIDLKVFLVDKEENIKIPISNVKLIKRNDITIKYGIQKSSLLPLARCFNYNWSGFYLEIDFEQDIFKNHSLPEGTYYLKGVLSTKGISREFRFGQPLPGLKTKPNYNIINSQYIYPKYNASWDLKFEICNITSMITDIEQDDKNIIFRGITKEIPSPNLFLVLNNREEKICSQVTIVEEDKNNSFIIFESRINKNDLGSSSKRGTWLCYISKGDNSLTDLILDINKKHKEIIVNENAIILDHTPNANLKLNVQNIEPKVINVEIKNNSALLTLSLAKQFFVNYENKIVSRQLKFVNSKNSLMENRFNPDNIEEDNNYYYYKFRFELFNFENKHPFFNTGTWKSMLILKDANNNELSLPINYLVEGDARVSEILFDIKFTFLKNLSKKLVLQVTPDWKYIERGPRRQEVIKKVIYPLLRLLPIKKKTIVFESYWGKSFSDNPRALYEYIDEKHPEFETVWFFKDQYTPITGRAKRVRINSFKYFYYLARAKYFVNNVNFPDIYKKRKKAVEIQTMHGTPLKTLGLDNPQEVPTEKHKKSLIQRCSRWDYLTVPSDYVASIAKRAYKFNKEVLKTGYPRNDKLFQKNNRDYINSVKKKLNLPSDKKIILYAPTWRIKGKYNLQLDLDMMKKELNDEYIILIRLHHFMTKGFSLEEHKDFAYDISWYDDISDLYLISDILITDYSSVMFDYALLDKPMLFFTYDYEKYKNQLRGMYFDFADESPGPLLFNTHEIVREIKDISNFYKKYGNKYRAFKEKFCQYDDGHACEKIYNAVLKGK
ncbi:bifunctional glycosyltransferase/CDP-glycerol:glycerophosphate glycerophosphotransferase [Caldibacillus debilis]|jgi:CDP-glycerol glycerophosphotransferase|uniref:Putative glycosyl/glycerophosphate transferase n=1 Tax=Caldibacillus debilis GB1 TaxID=1339248 RepID=A0A420VHM0_9BACI|nr:bifunctional glycosyltransferase/CDP-glycerol:glycerophosphate glycerophosphotransferase [Caldibacillus debilis]RKO63036.1 putative glycosyl/glycerophosphate transferase [Caldibacillus debilis GB1]